MKYRLASTSTTPRIRRSRLSSMLLRQDTAMADTAMNVRRIGRRRFQDTDFRSLKEIAADVVRARRPDRVVASPYDGRRKGSIVIMKMPKPKPVVRWIKLAPIQRRNM